MAASLWEITHGTGIDWRMCAVCQTRRSILFASSRRLHLAHLCTHGTPVNKNLGYLQVFPIIVSFLDHFEDGDIDALIAAMERRDRVQVVEIIVLPSSIEELTTAMQEPLSGSAPRLQTICISGISFPYAPTLLSSARDLVDVDLRESGLFHHRQWLQVRQRCLSSNLLPLSLSGGCPIVIEYACLPVPRPSFPLSPDYYLTAFLSISRIS